MAHTGPLKSTIIESHTALKIMKSEFSELAIPGKVLYYFKFTYYNPG